MCKQLVAKLEKMRPYRLLRLSMKACRWIFMWRIWDVSQRALLLFNFTWNECLYNIHANNEKAVLYCNVMCRKIYFIIKLTWKNTWQNVQHNTKRKCICKALFRPGNHICKIGLPWFFQVPRVQSWPVWLLLNSFCRYSLKKEWS